MVYDLSAFGLQQMIESGRQLRLAAQDASSMQEAARCVVDTLYDCFQTAGAPSCALVRCFETHPFADLPTPLQSLALSALPPASPPPNDLRCLALLASRGDLPLWNSPETSRAHRIIPMANADILTQAPMIARLIMQMGLTVDDVLRPEPEFLIELEKRAFNVFYVEDAVGSEYVPSQESFIIPGKVSSVLGFGGLLPAGEFFAVVMFSKVRIPRETAELFRTLALSVKLALLPFAGQKIFED